MEMIQKILIQTVEVSIAVSAVILVLILGQAVIRRRYAVKWNYWIWLLLAVRLLVPWNPDLSFGRLEPVRYDGWLSELSGELWNFGDVKLLNRFGPSEADGVSADGSVPVQETAYTKGHGVEGENPVHSLSVRDILTGLWFCGAVTVFGVNLSAYRRFCSRVLRRARQVDDKAILALVDSLAERICPGRDFRLLYSDEAESPMVIGFLHPSLVLPGVEYERKELEFILRHELIHCARRDSCYKLLLIAACAVHWFNPLVWLMRKRAGADLELSCDEAVVAHEPYEARRAYMEAILAAMSRKCEQGTGMTMQWNGSVRLMKQRMKHMLRPSLNKRGVGFASLVLVLLLSVETVLACGTGEIRERSEETDRQRKAAWERSAGAEAEKNISLQNADEDGWIHPEQKKIDLGAGIGSRAESLPFTCTDHGAFYDRIIGRKALDQDSDRIRLTYAIYCGYCHRPLGGYRMECSAQDCPDECRQVKEETL